MEKISNIAVPYAKALFALALEKNAHEDVYEDMTALIKLCRSNRDFVLMLKSPILKTDKKQKIMNAVFLSNVSELTRIFLTIITSKRRESLIPDMGAAFISIYKEYKGILTTYLKTAVPATDAIRKQVMEVMKKETTGTIELVEEVKDDLIGGFVLQWKDKQYDASILSQVNSMKRSMANINLYKKGI